jgi:hypothetical protein
LVVVVVVVVVEDSTHSTVGLRCPKSLLRSLLKIWTMSFFASNSTNSSFSIISRMSLLLYAALAICVRWSGFGGEPGEPARGGHEMQHGRRVRWREFGEAPTRGQRARADGRSDRDTHIKKMKYAKHFAVLTLLLAQNEENYNSDGVALDVQATAVHCKSRQCRAFTFAPKGKRSTTTRWVSE